MHVRPATCILAIALAVSSSAADDLLYWYEGDVLPYDKSAGWINGNPCEDPCSESVEKGRFVLRWTQPADLAHYHLTIPGPGEPPPSTLWVEWRFRSNRPLGANFFTCDAKFTVDYIGIHELIFMYGDAAISFSGDDAAFGLDIEEFHSYRFESLDGSNYRIAVDGRAFIVDAQNNPDASHFLQLRGGGGCDRPELATVNEWDFVRYGTISFGEQILAADPPSGIVDARTYAPLDRFTVTYDSPNYAYIDEITVQVTGSVAPLVAQSRRRENDGPDTVEIVLDRPIPLGETTRFTFDDGVAVNVVEYTFAPGDTNGDGLTDLHDVAAFQRCIGQTSPTGACWPLDTNQDDTIDLTDYRPFQGFIAGP